jgi:hypothetical protein
MHKGYVVLGEIIFDLGAFAFLLATLVILCAKGELLDGNLFDKLLLWSFGCMALGLGVAWFNRHRGE